MKRDDNKQSEFERLSSALMATEKPDLSDERKLFLKNSVLNKTNISVSSYVCDVSEDLVMDVSLRARIKARVFDLIEQKRQKFFYFSNVFRFHKKFVSAFVLFFMVFGMFPFLSFDAGVVMADTFTELMSCNGDVYVDRDGKKVNAYDGMKIYEQDRVVTGVDGAVSIRFFDDSVSRLAGDTEVVVNKLFRPSESSVKSYVEVSLVDGALWSKVVNLVEAQSSFVVEALNVYAMAKRAAFNVEINDDLVEIDVFNDSVDVRISESVDKLVGGQKVLLGDDRQIEIEQILESEMQVAWVEENLVGDEEHLLDVEQRLLAAKMESLGIEVGEDYDFDGSFKDEVLLFLTFDDIKKSKVELELAEKDFIAAEIKLNEGGLSEEENAEINVVISAFSESVEDFYEVVEEVAYTDVEYAEELERYVEDKVLTQKKSLSLVEPDSPSYEIKLVVDGLVVEEKEIIVVAEVVVEVTEAEDVVEEQETSVEEIAVEVEKVEVEVSVSEVDSEVDRIVPEEEVGEVEKVVDGNYGVTVEGDKPLSPLFSIRDL